MNFNPLDVGDVASVAAAVIALAALGLAWWSAASAAGSRKAADKSAEYAETSAQQAERSADAAETSAHADATMARLAEEEANRYTIPWRIEHDRKQRYRLIHDNDDETAQNVKIDGAAVHHLDAKSELGPQESMLFLLSPAMGMSRDVTITWRRPTDPEGELRSYTTQPPGIK